ncbi:PIR protein, putative [Plasmodium sp.]|nr:PIR protein, putative [Plasmodium sp.]
MISYNLKLIIFAIILGILTLIYNNDCDELYKNINNKNIVLVTTNFRSLAQLSYKPRTNHIHQNSQLREYGNRNEKKYKINIYPNDDTKTIDKIQDLAEKVNTVTTNLNKDKKEKYYREKDAKSNRSSGSIKYLEIQRKLYNNFYVIREMNFDHFSDKSNDNFCECTNKKKLYLKLTPSNKSNDKYLENLKYGCVGGAEVCAVSSMLAGRYGIYAGVSAGGAKLTGDALKLNGLAKAAASFNKAIEVGAFGGAFYPYGIAALVLILIVVVIIILYTWLYRRRRNSWKHEYKKHLCT